MTNSMCKKVNIKYSYLSQKGSEPINEDSVWCVQKDDDILLCIADGLGGHGKGEMASIAAVTISAAIFESSNLGGYDLLSACFETSQQKILEIQASNNDEDSFKSTMVLLLISQGIARWGHIGDSRLYFFRDGKVYKRTYDHSVPQILCLTGDIVESEIRHHADRNKLINVIGTEWNTSKYELLSENIVLERGDAFLLCTDGFWEWIDEKEMGKFICGKNAPIECLKQMEKQIIKNAGDNNMDNYSAICLKVE